MDKRLRIAIDGPAAAGKSTVTKNIANRLSIVYVDTGAMYRALTLKALQAELDLSDEDSLVQLLQSTTIELQQNEAGQTVLLDGKDVTEEIRSQIVSNNVSLAAGHEGVRKELVKRQKKMADNINVVMDGRDIGTHVLPDAEVKIFLNASVRERALRRHKENISKGFPSHLTALEKEIQLRDERDMNRKVSPLVQAKDAILIDTSDLSIQEVEEKILGIVEKYQQNAQMP